MEAEEKQARKVPQHYVEFLKRKAGRTLVTIEGVSAEIFPGVFHPATDAFLLAAHLQHYI
jgi:hypothetical protein